MYTLPANPFISQSLFPFPFSHQLNIKTDSLQKHIDLVIECSDIIRNFYRFESDKKNRVLFLDFPVKINIVLLENFLDGHLKRYVLNTKTVYSKDFFAKAICFYASYVYSDGEIKILELPPTFKRNGGKNLDTRYLINRVLEFNFYNNRTPTFRVVTSTARM